MATKKYKLAFQAEIKQVSSKKLASLDMEYRLVLSTIDGSVMNLGQLDGDQLYIVSVETQ